jgi:PAS domain S-box-containing protein
MIGGVVMDATERVRAEKEVAANRARLRALLDTIPDLVWLKDPGGVYLACNRRFEDFFGASEAEIVGRRDLDFVPTDLAAFFREKDLAAIQAGGPTTNEESVTFASDGHEEILETTKAPAFDQDGRLVGVLGIARDITQRRQAEHELRENAKRLEAAERIAHIGTWEYRFDDGRIICSDEVYRIFGLAPQARTIDEEWLGSRVHESDRSRHADYLRRLRDARPQEAIPEFQFRILRMDGEVRSLSAWVSVEFSPAGVPLRAFGTVQDVTERDQMHRDLQARLEELTRWQKVMLGREDRIQELKREINRLLATQHLPARYGSQADKA